jgi:hypothetical protein
VRTGLRGLRYSGVAEPIGIVYREQKTRAWSTNHHARWSMVIGLSDLACNELRPRRRLSWAELLWRAFALDVLECTVPGVPRAMKIIAGITQLEVIERLLVALDLLAEHSESDRARPQPQLKLPLDEGYDEPHIEAMDEGA